MKQFFPILLLFLMFSWSPLFAQIGTNNRMLFTTDLNGQQETPSVSGDGRGIATVLLSEDRTTMSIHAVFTGLSGPVTGCHFHTGAAAVAGPVVVNLTTAVVGNRLRVEMPVTPEVIASALKGEIYLNVHTAANPTGEIRGQLGLANDYLAAAAMSGVKEVPPVVTSASGLFKMSFPPGYFYAGYIGEVNGLSGPITAAHIHAGAEGVAGPVVTPLTIASSTTLVGQIDLTTVPGGFYQQLDNAELYVNAHTAANPGGEIRGQLINFGPMAFEATLNGDQETPAVSSSAFGVAVAGLNSTLDSVTYLVGVNGLVPTAAHFHVGAAGVAGPVIIPLQASALPNFYFGKVPVNSTQVTALLNSNIYVNVHTAAHPAGEIRGQMQPLLRRVYVFDLCGAQEVPVNSSTAQGTGYITTDYLNTHLNYRYIASGLSGTATAAHIHDAAFGVSGPVSTPLLAPNPVGSGQFPIDGSFSTQLESNNTYLNVHTAANPNGEIRGQIMRESSCAFSVGVSELFLLDLQITPNPTNGRTTIQFSLNNPFDGQLVLTDITGKTVLQEKRHFTDGAQSIDLDLSPLPAGMYIAQLNNQQGLQRSFKLIRD